MYSAFSHDKKWLVVLFLMAGTALGVLPSYANVAAPPQAVVDADKVDFTADSITYDETAQIITAEGNVDIAQAGQIVKAQKVIYRLNDDVVEAVGDVVFTEKNGDVHFAERASFQRKLKDGYIKALKSILADGSRVKAAEGTKTGAITTMKDASYTACEECKTNPDKPVLWQIVADEVTHDNDAHTVSYKNAKFEIYDVPVMYLPYFSHSDGSIKQQSGFLAPKLSLNSQLGLALTSRYYYAISPSEDATIGARIFTKDTPQLLGEYRKRFNAAALEFNSSGIYSNDDNEFRGHLFGEGLWDINSKWRAGFSTELTTDDTYLRAYDISRKNVLENQFYTEYFNDRDYFAARGLMFQDVRVSDRSKDQPSVLPELTASFMGDPNAALGGRWNLDLSSVNLYRNGNGQDVLRASAELGWQRRDETPMGLVNTVTLASRGDAYQIADRDETSVVGGTGGANAFRFYPVLHDVVSYPVAQDLDGAQWVVEPTVAFTAAPRVKNDTNIPNEDSQDAQIDVTNIFEANRFPGFDRVEDGSHVTYGARTGIYSNDGSVGEIFLGQSYRLNVDGNIFPDGSGLSTRTSDVVGQIMAQYQDMYSVNYRFQLASDNFQSERHELDTHLLLGDLTLSGTYLYARKLERTDIQQSRQQIYGSAAYKLDDNWNISTAARYDLSAEDKGLRYTYFGLNYIGQCFNVLTSVRRNYADTDTGDNATELSIQIGFKNLGTFGTDQ